MATTLVIAGYYGFGNWGDEAALAVLIRYLREALPQARIIVLSHDPAQTARLHGTEAINRWNLLEIHRALARASGFLLGPGGLLQDVTSARSLLYYVGLVRLAQHYHLPTYLIGQGIGPLRSQRSERWVAKVLQRARLVLVRDRTSFEWALAQGAHVALGEDLALLSPLPWLTHGRGAGGEGRSLGISLRPGLSPHNKEALRRALRALSTDFELIFLPLQADQDRAVLQELALAIPAVEARCPDDLLRAMQNLDIVVGMRLHSLVFALVCDVPFCALSYDPKIESFVQHIAEVGGPSLSWWRATEALDERDLTKQIHEMYSQRATLQESLRRARMALQTNAHGSLNEAVRVIVSDLGIR